MVELAGGLCLAAFSSPATASHWALSLIEVMLHAPWDEELLEHVSAGLIAAAVTALAYLILSLMLLLARGEFWY